VAVLVGYVLFLWSARNQWAKGFRTSGDAPGALTAHMIDEFRRVNPRPRPNSSVALLNDPFEGWDMFFIAQLWIRDRTVEMRLENKTPEPLARFDYVFDYRDGKLVEVPHVKSQ